MDSNQIYHRLGESNGELKAINRRLDEGSKRHAELGAADQDTHARLARLELIEARRGGVLAAIAAFGSLFGGLVAIAIQYVLKKF